MQIINEQNIKNSAQEVIIQSILSDLTHKFLLDLQLPPTILP